MRVWAHRACWLLAVTLFALLPLCACAPGATSSATLRASPTAPPTARTRPTYPPCDRATQWQAPAGNIALDALSMVRADEGWATGEVNPDVPNVPLPTAAVLYHMVNGQWQRLPQTYPGAELTSLSMDSPSDGWAVSPTPMTGSAHPLILHYTSGAWQPADIPALDAFPLPTANSGGISPGSVQMFGPQAGWMFATTNEDPDTSPKSLVLRYEGGVWTVTPGPQVASTVELGPLTAVSADEAWMLGFDPNAKVTTTLIYHYINGAWGNTAQTFPFEASLTMLSADDGWAVGSTDSNEARALHYDGVRWTQVAIPATWSAQDVIPIGPVFAIAPGVVWVVTWVFTATYEPGMGLGLWQYANTHWSPVAWPFPDLVPTTLAPGTAGEEWGSGNISIRKGVRTPMSQISGRASSCTRSTGRGRARTCRRRNSFM